jgi:tetratricopeptide (TPR) repeat protein
LVDDFPVNAVAWYQRGLSLALVAGGQPAALECLTRATRIDPDFVPAWRALASILGSISGREDEARQCAERAAALERGAP